MDLERPTYMSDLTGHLGDAEKATDFLQPKPWTEHWSESETYYFNFFIPSRKLDGLVYLKIRPNLRTCHSGVFTFSGVKRHHLQAEHFNFQQFLPFPEVSGNTLHVPEIDLTVTIVEPLTRHRIDYSDPRSGTELHFVTEAISPPAMRGNNAHFDQVMQTNGTLLLLGEELEIDCVQVRDRSWGEPRPESPLRHPPTAWCTGASADGTVAFTFSGADDPARDAGLETYGIPARDLFKDGWFWSHGSLKKIVRMSKLTQRHSSGLRPETIDCRFTDETGAEHHVRGSVESGLLWSPWPNMALTYGCHFRWDLELPDGTLAELRGEAQEIYWHDSVRQLLTAEI